MASTINATPTSSGLISTADNSGVLALQTGGTTAVTVDGSQNVGIGTASPSQKLSVAGLISATGRTLATGFFNTTNVTGVIVDASSADYYVNNAFAMRIDSSGNLLVGATSVDLNVAGIRLRPAGNGANIPFCASAGSSSSNSEITWAVYSSSATQYQFYVGYGGTVYARSTSITGLSDISEKENIKDIDTGLNTVMLLKPRRFDWKDGSKQNVAGFIAQEVETVLPDLVEEYKINDEETKKGLKMGDILPTLVKAIQELNAKVDAQATTIAELQAKLPAENT
jgi:hypothetical protein